MQWQRPNACWPGRMGRPCLWDIPSQASGKTKHAGWRSKPSFNAVSTEDRTINPELVEYFKQGPHKRKVRPYRTDRCRSGDQVVQTYRAPQHNSVLDGIKIKCAGEWPLNSPATQSKSDTPPRRSRQPPDRYGWPPECVGGHQKRNDHESQPCGQNGAERRGIAGAEMESIHAPRGRLSQQVQRGER
jgi:hypothetical protein